MKKQHKSFASRARELESRYKRLAFDKLEQEEFEAEMTKLQEEQEMVRNALGMNQQEQPMQEFGNGGKMMFPTGGFVPYGVNNIYPQKLPEDAYLTPEQLSGMGSPNKPLGFQPSQDWLNSIGWNSKIPTEQDVKTKVKGGNNGKGKDTQVTPQTSVTNNVVDPSGWNNVVDNITNYPYKAPTVPTGQTTNNFSTAENTPIRDNKFTQNLNNELAAGNAPDKNNFWSKNKGMLPYAISGASNIAGNLLLAAMAKKNQQRINPVLATPERMNMEPQAEQFRKDASVSKNIGLRQARDLGLNAGATLANMGAIGSGVDRQLGSNLTNLYGQQEQFNVGTANQFASQNQDAANRTNLVNTQLKSEGLQDQLGYLSGALGTIPGVMKDVRMDKADKEMREIMKTYYKNLGGKNYQTMSDLFNDPEAFQYFVKEFNKKQGK